MTWVKCSEGVPDSEGDILVKINGKLFLGYVYPGNAQPINLRHDFIIYQMPCLYPGDGKWLLPAHYREPDEWMYVP